uniref:Uncharacterized protein n=1 Tax=Arundo donax TaxID=35708 RepID=A0A0A9CQZ4_ARUDO
MLVQLEVLLKLHQEELLLPRQHEVDLALDCLAQWAWLLDSRHKRCPHHHCLLRATVLYRLKIQKLWCCLERALPVAQDQALTSSLHFRQAQCLPHPVLCPRQLAPRACQI